MHAEEMSKIFHMSLSVLKQNRQTDNLSEDLTFDQFFLLQGCLWRSSMYAIMYILRLHRLFSPEHVSIPRSNIICFKIRNR